ncbi:FadR/GntR family transcriptional regulator [Lacisediminihabitans profunda]|uniref:FadR family transcriptional regulator n=1 Tax=Lacisediminihabitans profunda TaxID=2594790 RepID=A0A5C8UTG4_9MICO|nr:FadR/GntR family transcriptional regulator [Lacisediminihabitans profunda]TXN30898.1 FadR family transcriptional regulator [Lacisediminihabitans profunda]
MTEAAESGPQDGSSVASVAIGDVGSPWTGLHAQLLDKVGLAICAGDLRSGSVLRIEELEERYGVSRSVVREAIRVLASMGMVASRRRVGVQIRPATEWNLYDPQVIRWRLASPGRISQLRSLTELRTAIEPEAARLAAVRAPLANASELMGLAGKLWAAGQAGEEAAFLTLDIEFHRLVLASSGNEMFAKLNALVAEVLTGRTQYGLMPSHPHNEALQLHVNVASAIQRGNPADAHEAMLGIMQRASAEMSSIWESHSTDITANPSPNVP